MTRIGKDEGSECVGRYREGVNAGVEKVDGHEEDGLRMQAG